MGQRLRRGRTSLGFYRIPSLIQLVYAVAKYHHMFLFMNRRFFIFKLLAAGLMTPGVSLPVWAGAKKAQAQSMETSSQETVASTVASTMASTPRPKTSPLKVYRSPTCDCCGAWVEHMETNGFQVQVQITEDMDAIKRQCGIPQAIAACHTGLIEGYWIEGHIPAEDVWRLLTERPNIAGLLVPGMPLGSPGMEQGNKREPYTVFTFTKMGAVTVFAKHK